MKDFVPYAVGVCAASVCTSLHPEDAEQRLNQEHPTGIASRWALAAGEDFRTGEVNGMQCPDNPTHRHFLFHC